MKTSFLPLAGVVFLTLFTGCNPPVNVLVVVGGHSFDTTDFFYLFNSMEGIEMDSAYYPEAMEMMRSGKTDVYEVLVFYDYMADLPAADSSVFQNLTRQGKPLLFLHHAICSFQQWDGYGEMVGGKYVMAGPGVDPARVSDYKHDIDMEIEVVDRQHPVTMGLQDFTIHDEGYSNITLSPDIIPLLKTGHPDCYPTLGWTRTTDQSSIVYLMLGHDRQAYQNPFFMQLVKQSIFWLADQDPLVKKQGNKL